MKKIITKTFLTLCLAFSFYVCSSFFACAAEVSPNAVNHTHYFTVPTHIATKTSDAGFDTYVWAYDVNRNPIYRSDCRLTDYIWVYDYQCEYCDLLQGAIWEKTVFTKHSISHDK